MFLGETPQRTRYRREQFAASCRRATTYDKRFGDHTQARDLLNRVVIGFLQDFNDRATRAEEPTHPPPAAGNRIILPQEMWAAIISNITSRKNLFTLLLTSRLLNEEAERILYRKLNLKTMSHQHQSQILTHLSTSPRVAQYVRSLEIKIDPDLDELARRALNALCNLKDLSLWISTTDTLLPFLDSSQLCKFRTSVPIIDNRFKLFLLSQPRITVLSVQLYQGHLAPDVILSRSDVPALSALACYGPIHPEVLIPGAHISNLQLSNKFTTPSPFARVLKTKNVSASMGTLYPNLRFLHVSIDMLTMPLPKFSFLKKLKIAGYSIIISLINSVTDQYSAFFNCCESLNCLEIYWRQFEGDPDLATVIRIQERPVSQSTVVELVAEICFESLSYHESEWETWRE